MSRLSRQSDVPRRARVSRGRGCDSGTLARVRTTVGIVRRSALASAGRCGLIDPIRFTFGIDEVRDDDTFIVSYPRSGNTWVRYILAYLDRGVGAEIGYDEINSIVPDAYHSATQINRTPGRRMIKIHEPFLDACPRLVYIHRDYRASLVSYWLFTKRFKGTECSFSEFLRSSVPHEHGSWKEHMRALCRRQAAHPDSMLVIPYESLVSDFSGTVARLVAWSGVGGTVDIEAVRRRTELATLAAVERRGGSAFNATTGSHFYADSGRGLAWRSYWSAADVQWLARDRELVTLMEQHGYRWA